MNSSLHGSISSNVEFNIINWNGKTGQIEILEDFELFYLIDRKHYEDVMWYFKSKNNYFKSIHSKNNILNLLSILDKQTGKRFLIEYKDKNNDIIAKTLELRKKYS